MLNMRQELGGGGQVMMMVSGKTQSRYYQLFTALAANCVCFRSTVVPAVQCALSYIVCISSL